MSLKSLLSRRSSPEDRTPERDEWVGEYEVAQADLSKDADNDDEARSQMMRIEKDGPPKNLADWPTGKAMSFFDLAVLTRPRLRYLVGHRLAAVLPGVIDDLASNLDGPVGVVSKRGRPEFDAPLRRRSR
jgi:hypothetical protein